MYTCNHIWLLRMFVLPSSAGNDLRPVAFRVYVDPEIGHVWNQETGKGDNPFLLNFLFALISNLQRQQALQCLCAAGIPRFGGPSPLCFRERSVQANREGQVNRVPAAQGTHGTKKKRSSPEEEVYQSRDGSLGVVPMHWHRLILLGIHLVSRGSRQVLCDPFNQTQTCMHF